VVAWRDGGGKVTATGKVQRCMLGEKEGVDANLLPILEDGRGDNANDGSLLAGSCSRGKQRKKGLRLASARYAREECQLRKTQNRTLPTCPDNHTCSRSLCATALFYTTAKPGNAQPAFLM
jgi:hypothetical protein